MPKRVRIDCCNADASTAGPSKRSYMDALRSTFVTRQKRRRFDVVATSSGLLDTVVKLVLEYDLDLRLLVLNTEKPLRQLLCVDPTEGTRSLLIDGCYTTMDGSIELMTVTASQNGVLLYPPRLESGKDPKLLRLHAIGNRHHVDPSKGCAAAGCFAFDDVSMCRIPVVNREPWQELMEWVPVRDSFYCVLNDASLRVMDRYGYIRHHPKSDEFYTQVSAAFEWEFPGQGPPAIVYELFGTARHLILSQEYTTNGANTWALLVDFEAGNVGPRVMIPGMFCPRVGYTLYPLKRTSSSMLYLLSHDDLLMMEVTPGCGDNTDKLKLHDIGSWQFPRVTTDREFCRACTTCVMDNSGRPHQISVLYPMCTNEKCMGQAFLVSHDPLVHPLPDAIGEVAYFEAKHDGPDGRSLLVSRSNRTRISCGCPNSHRNYDGTWQTMRLKSVVALHQQIGDWMLYFDLMPIAVDIGFALVHRRLEHSEFDNIPPRDISIWTLEDAGRPTLRHFLAGLDVHESAPTIILH